MFKKSEEICFYLIKFKKVKSYFYSFAYYFRLISFFIGTLIFIGIMENFKVEKSRNKERLFLIIIIKSYKMHFYFDKSIIIKIIYIGV